MGKSSPSAPAAPDPAATAAAQTATNKETAYWNAVLNNVNQITPYGNLSYKQTGGGKTYNMDAYNSALNTYNNGLASGGVSIPQGVVYAGGGWLDQNTGEYLPQSEQQRLSGVNQANTLTAPKMEDYITGDAPPSFTSTIELSPEQKKLYETQVGQQQQLADLGGAQISRIQASANTPFSYGGIGNEVTAEGTAEAQKRAEEALLSRLAPQFGKDEESLRSRLVNQGITQGSEAYNREFDAFNQKQNDARMQAVLSAAQYGGTLQDQTLARRNQAIQEYTTQRNAPLNEYSAFTSGTQIQNPTFQNTSYAGAAPADYAGLVNQKYQADLGAYNSKVAGKNATTSSLFGLGGQLGAAYMMAPVAASDIRLKYNITQDGTENGFNMYKFSYLGDDSVYRGLMAQEVEQTHPEAVVEHLGYKAVNYDMLGLKMERL